MKNILLVMQSGGYLAPPQEKPEQAELWNQTWTRLNRFLPDLYAELYPEEAAKPRRSKEEKAVPVGEKAATVEEEVTGGKDKSGQDDRVVGDKDEN
jgi:brefeldin A-resistance guanine nucleotide exchange factor 1